MAEQKRQIFYLSEESQKQYEDIRQLFERNGMSQKHSDAFKQIVAIFYELFIETNASTSIATRLEQLKGMSSDDLSLQRVMKRQLDMITYLTLSNYHMAKDSSWSPTDLTSIHTNQDVSQNELLSQVMNVVQQDISRGQTKKYSHKKE